MPVDAVTRPTVLLAGPTASGKSRLALKLAESLAGFGGAQIINADSMQVYAELRVLTARPSLAEEARAPHRLYGVASVRDPCSAGRWRKWARAEIAAAHAEGAVPIVVGGTGLYFRALLDGIARVPDVPPDIRRHARERAAAPGGVARLLAELAADDPAAAAALAAGDTQRIVRAWEVLAATGESLRVWQARGSTESLRGSPTRIVLEPDLDDLNAAIGARVAAMPELGVLDEVAALLKMNLPAALPATRAVGAAAFAAAVRGEMSVAEAVAQVQRATRQYAKRQRTWFRTQAKGWTPWQPAASAQYWESFPDNIIPVVCGELLTASS